MKLLLLSFLALGAPAWAGDVSSMAIAPGLDTTTIAALAKRSAVREMRRMAATVSNTKLTDNNEDRAAVEVAAAHSNLVLKKVRLSLESATKLTSEARALVNKPVKKLTETERRQLLRIYISERTQQTTDLLTKLAYGNDDIRDWLARAQGPELDKAVDIFQNPKSHEYRRLMNRIAQQNASVARKIRKQVDGEHLMTEPVFAGMGLLAPAPMRPKVADRQGEEEKRNPASSK